MRAIAATDTPIESTASLSVLQPTKWPGAAGFRAAGTPSPPALPTGGARRRWCASVAEVCR